MVTIGGEVAFWGLRVRILAFHRIFDTRDLRLFPKGHELAVLARIVPVGSL